MNKKNQIKNRHKGRGNTWLKIDINSSIYRNILNILKPLESSNIINYFEKAGYAWIRFSKANKDDTGRYEIRYRGSKMDHPDCTIDLSLEELSSLTLLGNTPVKLFLETNKVKKEVNKKVKVAVNKQLKSAASIEINETNIKERMNNVKNVLPTQSTQKELDTWHKWCRLNGIYSTNEEL
jgi:hypothetical protein